ncbi:MAG: nickel-dependent lactate racemase [Synergistetes bacterium]|nr:nickel-dependent lactate racemase [Synergistota bacterium]
MMKEYQLPIGDKSITFKYESKDIIDILQSKPFPEVENEEDIVKKALEKPTDSAPLKSIVRPKDKVCILFSDMTRLWVRHHIFMPFILEELKAAGVKDENMCAICGNGDHRDNTEEEFKLLLGEKPYSFLKGRIYNHHARSEEENVHLGETTFGTPVEINRHILEADKVILTGGIVHHFLDGFGGGKKAIMPGVSSRKSIMKNHSLALHPIPGKGLDPNVGAGIMRGNRLSEDSVEVASFINPAFLVNSVVTTSHKIAYIAAGNYITAHEKGAEFCNEHYSVKIDTLADLTIISCGGYPADINFYQTYKTLYNAERATKPGGVIILLTESREGIGNDDFYSMFKNYPNNAEREKALRENYTIGGHMAFHDALMAEKFHIYVMSDLPDNQIREAGMIPIKSIEEGISYAQEIVGKHPSTYIIPYGHEVFPILK